LNYYASTIHEYRLAMVFRRYLFLIVLIGTVPRGALGQDERPPSCTTDELKTLLALEGEWNVHGSIRLPDGVWDEVAGRARFSVDLDGCVVIERYEDDRSAGPLSGLAMYAFDPLDGRQQKTWLDSVHGSILLFRGGPVGDKVIFNSKRDIRGTTHYFVEEYAFESKDRFVHERRRAKGDRKTWRATSRLMYERQ
jgi:hypothetical protein